MKARQHRRSDRAKHEVHAAMYGVNRSKAQQRIFFDSAHMGAGFIEGMPKVKD